MLHAAVVHYEEDNVGFGSANLKADAAAFDAHRSGSAPTGTALAAAYREPAAIFRAEDESGLFHAEQYVTER